MRFAFALLLGALVGLVVRRCDRNKLRRTSAKLSGDSQSGTALVGRRHRYPTERIELLASEPCNNSRRVTK